jgi:sugar O-acyltransferase (sialic acid O-acetyltransferase NeuD family)
MKSGRDLVIIGTGGLAKEMGQLARQIDPSAKRWRRICYCANDASRKGLRMPYGTVSYIDEEIIVDSDPFDVVLGVGFPWLREKLGLLLAKNSCLHFPNLIHPSVMLDKDMVRLGEGNVITQGCVLTCDISIADFNLLNWNSTIGHDARIGSFNVINPAVSISGHVQIGNACLIGTGARIIEKLELASNTVIGAGAVVTHSILNAGVYVGVPAKLKSNVCQ